MPVTICGVTRAPTPSQPPSRSPPATPAGSRRQRFDDAVRKLAPVIAEIRKGGHTSIADIAVALNLGGLSAPSGGAFTYETTRRILKRIETLGLGPGPRTVSQALMARHDKDRARRARALGELAARRKRQHPDWD